MPKFWTFNVKAEANSAELLLYGPISKESWWEDDVSPKQFSDDLKALGNITELTVRINSPGGDLFAAQAIYSLIKSHAANVTVHIDGLAASAASVVAMAGNTVVMPRNAMMMIHNPMMYTGGNANDLRKSADMLDQARETMLAAYLSKAGTDREKIIELLDAETWLTADEALEYGLIDQIDEVLQIAASLDGKNLVVNGQTFDISGFKTLPNIKSRAEPPAKPPEENVDNEKTKQKGVLNLKNIDELRTAYPEMVAQIEAAAKAEGVNEGNPGGIGFERDRN